MENLQIQNNEPVQQAKQNQQYRPIDHPYEVKLLYKTQVYLAANHEQMKEQAEEEKREQEQKKLNQQQQL